MSSRRDVKSNVESVVLFPKIQVTASQTIQGTDITKFHGAGFVVDVGTHTANDLTVTFQHRDAAEAWADIPDAQLEGSSNDIAIVSGQADSQIYVNYIGSKEDIGAIITDGGTGDAVVGVRVIKMYPKQFPVN